MIDVRTYRASSMQEALALVRRELGAEAVILHTRTLRRSLLGRLRRQAPGIEITAGIGVKVRSRQAGAGAAQESTPVGSPGAARSGLDEQVQGQLNRLSGMLEEVIQRSRHQHVAQLPDHFLSLHAELVEADVPEELARQFTYTLHEQWPGAGASSLPQLRARLIELIAKEFHTHGPVQTIPGERKVLALVGPTGVGKTTTIAKLAANFRLREGRRVGLITVDTYRVAAVEHLRAYAEIIDLPMKVVMNPRDMRWALSELQDVELVLIDTAGRSPREDLKIHELKMLLQEAGTDEVHLVLCAAASLRSLITTAEKFSTLGLTALLLTKLDEAASLGGLIALARATHLPSSYLTTGQSVPDDIETTDAGRLARLILGQEHLRG